MNCRLQVVLRIFAGYVVLHANKVYRNIKNRTVCFQERFRLLSLAAVLKSWKQISSIFYLSRAVQHAISQLWKSVNPSYKRQNSKMKSHNREFLNVNGRFCGAIHSVNRACISVFSQVIFPFIYAVSDLCMYSYICPALRYECSQKICLIYDI